MTTRALEKADVLRLLADIEEAIANNEAASRRYADSTEPGAIDGNLIRRGKIEAYWYVREKLLNVARWKGVDVGGGR